MTPELYKILFDHTEEELAKINIKLLNITEQDLKIIQTCKILEKRLIKANQNLNLLNHLVKSITQLDSNLRKTVKEVESLFVKQDDQIEELEELLVKLRLE